MINGRIVRVMEIAAMVLAIVGVVFNNQQMLVCFPIWIVSNVLSALLHYRVGYWWMLTRDVVFVALAVWGWISWAAL